MSDTLNALASAQHSSSVLAGIANPQIVNPLATMSSAVNVASGVYGLREKQADAAWGSALQAATDENGTVDYAKAQRLAAHDPMATQGMLKALGDTSRLRGQQIEQAGALYGLQGQLSASVMNDPSDANMASIRAHGVNAGLSPSQIAEIDRIAALPENQRVAEAYKHNVGAIDALGRLGRGGYPNPVQTQMPQGLVTTTTQPATPYGPASTQQVGGVGSTLSPSEVVAQGVQFQADERYVREHPGTALGATILLPGTTRLREQGLGRYIPPGATDVGGGGGGVVNPDGSRAGPNSPPRLLPMPGQGARTAPTPAGGGGAAQPVVPPNVTPGPPMTPGGPPVTTPYTGPAGMAPALKALPAPAAAQPPPATPPAQMTPPATTPPATTPPATTPPPTTPRPALPPNAPLAALQGGVQVAAGQGGVPVAAANALGAPSAPTPQARANADAIMRGMQNARTAPAVGPRVADNAVSYGPGVQEVGQWKASTDRLAADDTMAANYAQTQFPLTQALAGYGKGTVTGPGADFWNRVAGYIRTPLQKIGVDVSTLDDNTKRYDALNKWLGQIVATTPFAAGSDARLSQVLNGSANTHINQAAGEDMIKAGLVLQRMNVAANNQWHAMSTEQQSQYGGLYLNYLRGYSNTVDPRAFGVDMYNPEQKANLAKAIRNGSEADARRFNDSVAIANGVGSQQALP